MTTAYPTRGIVTAGSFSALYGDGDVFPNFPGRDLIVSKAPNWSTMVKQASSGAEVRASLWAQVLYSFKLQHNVLRDRSTLPSGSELTQIVAFFNSRRGRFGFFFFLDPNDYLVPSQQFATGDGTTTTFQLIRAVGYGTPYAATEPVYALWNAPTIWVAGTPTTAFTVAPWGLITFTTAPAAGAALTWTGGILFVCRFDDDKMELGQLFNDLWEQKGLTFTGIAP